MTIERHVRTIAGALVLASVAVSHPACPLFLSTHFLWVTAFVGLILFQSGFTGVCPMATILRKLGVAQT